MFKNRSSLRFAIVASALIALAAITATATRGTQFAFIDSVQEFFGMARTTTAATPSNGPSAPEPFVEPLTNLLTENFSYTTGQLTNLSGGANVSGGNWVNYSGTGTAIQVSSGGLSYSGYPQSGIGNKIDIVATTSSAEDTYRQFTTQTTGTTYAAFIVNVTDTTLLPLNASATGEYFAGYLSSTSTTTLDSRVSIRTGSVAGTYQLGLRASGTSTGTFSTTNLSPGTTQLVVISYQIVAGSGNDIVKMWINPSLGGSEPSATLTETSLGDLADVSRLFIRQGSGSGVSTPNASIDGILVGTTWADVTPVAAVAPAVTSLNPTSGSTAGGNSVTINGTDLASATGVTFGGTSCPITSNTATQIQCTAPARSAGTVDVIVTTAGGSSANTAADDYTYLDPPTVTSLSPTSGPTAGGTSVTITGSNFAGATVVSFGGTPATSFTVDSATQITATAPPRSAGAVNVIVTTPGGISADTAADDYTYIPPPTLGTYPAANLGLSGNTTVTPSAAPLGTTRMRVTAPTSFIGELTADPATGVVRITNAHLAKIPAGAYTVTVRAFGPGGITTTTFNLTVTPTACVGTSGFASPATPQVTVGTSPRSVAIGDFNGDGIQDFATANFDSDNVSIRLGNGSGGFTADAEVPVGTDPRSVAIGDFNGDGKQDFATANNSSDNVSIRLGNGSGGFTSDATPEVTVGTNPSSVAIGDFNGDGIQDFATANGFSANVSIRLGNDSGGFIPPATPEVTVGFFPLSIAIGDFNGDGNQDFATANGDSDDVSIRLGNGSGGFASPATPEVTVGPFPQSVAIGDFNGDGNQDFAAANNSSNDVSIRLGNGLGEFTSPATPQVTVGTGPYSVAIGDFNGNGNQDFAAANFNSNNASIRLGNGLGGFTSEAAPEVTVGTNPSSVAIGDFNGDGKQDFATANADSNNVSILLGICTSLAPTVTSVNPTSGPQGGGNSVVITGTNFTGATAVSFGGTAATMFTVDSATQITATAPARSAGTVDVIVTTAGGSSANTSADDYTYVAATNAKLSSITLTGPSTAISPTFDPNFGIYGATVANSVSSITINGTAQDPNASVQINGGSFAPSSNSGTVTLSVGSNSFNVAGKAEDGVTTFSYTVNITRQVAPDYEVTTTATSITVTDLSGNGDTIDISLPSAGNILFTNSAPGTRTFSVNGAAATIGNSGNLSLSGITQVTFNGQGGADIINVGALGTSFPNLTVNGGQGNDTLNFNGDITFASGSGVDADLTNDDASPGTGDSATINNADLIMSGAGSFTLKVTSNIQITGTGSADGIGSTVRTASGNISMESNQLATAATGFRGIYIDDSVVEATGTGTVDLKGRGGVGCGTCIGIGMRNFATVKGGTTGAATTLTGNGGSGTNVHGLEVGFDSTISSNGGNVSVTGTGGSGAGTTLGFILFPTGIISTTGNGSIVAVGTGGTGGSGNDGIRIDGSLSKIAAAGTGTVSVTATGGASDSPGLNLSRSGSVTAVSGSVSITGTHGGNGTGIFLDSASSGNPIISTVNQPITLIADKMNFLAGSVSPNTGTVNLRTLTGTRTIEIGGNDSASVLGLTDAELDRVAQFGTLTLGDGAHSGVVNVVGTNGAITQARTMNILSPVTTTVTSTGDLGMFGTLAGPLTVDNGGKLRPGSSPGVINSGAVTQNSTSEFYVELGGTTAGNGAGFHDRVASTGTFAAAGTLNVSFTGGFTPTPVQTFTIATSTGATSGTYGTVTWPIGYTGTVTYNANDIVLSNIIALAPTVTTNAVSLVTSTAATLNGTANPNGTAATGWFRYSATDPGTCSDSFGTRAPASGGSALGAGTSGVAFAQAISSLLPGTTYYYCAIASNTAGTAFGSVLNFTTPAAQPVVTTNAATLVTTSTATLNGTANPGGAATTGWFRYSTTSPGTCNDTFGTRAPSTGGTALGSGNSAVAFSEALTGLTDNTTYYYCAIAQNTIGTGFGTVMQFMTPAVIETSAGISGGNLVVSDGNGGTSSDNLTIVRNGPNVRISDPVNTIGPGAGCFSVTATAVDCTAVLISNIQIDTLDGNDTLTVDYSGGPLVVINYNGGAGGNDALILTGGSPTTQTFNFTNEHDGGVEFIGGDISGAMISYTGLEPVSSTVNAANVVLNYSTVTETIAVTDAGGGQTTVDSNVGGESVTFNNPTTSLEINGGDTGDDTINVNGFGSGFGANLTINGGTGNDSVNFTGDLSLIGNAGIDVDLQNDNAAPGTDSISFAVDADVALAPASNGDVVLKASRSVRFQDQSSLSVGLGTVTIEANQQAIPTGGDFAGVSGVGTSISNQGPDPIIIKGRGGNAGGAALTENAGVRFALNSAIFAFDTGDVSITGDSGDGGADAAGIQIVGGSTVGTNDGDLTMTGRALGTSLAGDRRAGIVVGGVLASGITAGGSGNLIMMGTGASAAGNGHFGVLVDAGSSVMVANGTTTITGFGGDPGAAIPGVDHDGIRLRGVVSSTGTGLTTLNGTAGTTTAAGHDGVNISAEFLVSGSGNITTGGGNVIVNGVGTGNGYGANLNAGGGSVVDTTSGGGNIAILANRTNITDAPATGERVLKTPTANAVALVPSSAGQQIDLGGADVATALGLTDAELDRITTGTLNFGDANTGDITTTSAITRAAATVVNLTSGASVNINAGQIDSGGGNVTASPNAAGFLFVGNPGVDVTTGASSTFKLASGRTLRLFINSPTVDTGYLQLNVAGQVDITGTDLLFGSGSTATPGASYTIINNDAADAITGTFNGMPDEFVITNFLGSGLNARIDYQGGDGNDCVITMLAPIPEIQFSSATYIEDESQTATVTVTRSGDLTNPSTVSFNAIAAGGATVGATCTPTADYAVIGTPLPRTLTFGTNVGTQTVQFAVCGDSVIDPGEGLNMSISSPTNATLGTQATAVLSFNDTASRFLSTIPHEPIDMTLGSPAVPYPSQIVVAGAPNIIGGMRVTLYDIWHDTPDNIDVLLVGPQGQKYVLMADVGGPFSIGQGAPVTLTFSDIAPAVLGDSATLVTGLYRPTTCETPVLSFFGPAPAGPYVEPGCTLARPQNKTLFGTPPTGFGMTNPNGTWRLFVRDDNGALRPVEAVQTTVGSISGGWGLEFFAPTAADVSISGRVTTAEGRGIRNARVTVTGNSLTTPITVSTGVNGRYTVSGLTPGETYVVTVGARRFFFEQPSRVITLQDSVTDADFTGSAGTSREQ